MLISLRLKGISLLFKGFSLLLKASLHRLLLYCYEVLLLHYYEAFRHPLFTDRAAWGLQAAASARDSAGTARPR